MIDEAARSQSESASPVELKVVRGADELTLAVDLGGRGTPHQGSV